VLVFVNIKVRSQGVSLDELWEVWQEETKAALGAMEAGKVVTL
jgi:hypothetical protein